MSYGVGGGVPRPRLKRFDIFVPRFFRQTGILILNPAARPIMYKIDAAIVPPNNHFFQEEFFTISSSFLSVFINSSEFGVTLKGDIWGMSGTNGTLIGFPV